jgi:hypothetical protein
MNEDEEYEYIEQRRLEHEKWVREKSIKLEVGKTYLQKSASWAIKHYKILSIEGKVALGIVVYDGIYNSKTRGCGEYALFRVDTGEKYQEPRLNYALIEEVNN